MTDHAGEIVEPLRERITDALVEYHNPAGVNVDTPEELRDLVIDCAHAADAIIADLGLRPVARVKEYALETGAEWIDEHGEKIEHGENPHHLPDDTLLYVLSDSGSQERPNG